MRSAVFGPLNALVALSLCAFGVAGAQEVPQAFVGARIIPIEGDELAEGVLVVHQGKITAVGAGGAIPIPDNAQRIDAAGKVIMPGLVDTHTHVGEISGGDSSGPIHPEARILDSFNVRHAGLQRAQAGGLTTINVMPGSGHLLSGQTLYLKLRDGEIVDDLLIFDEEGNIAGGMKMANGTNSQRDPPFPETRAKSAALVRTEFVKAQEYQKKIERADGAAEKMPDRDLRMEGLLKILNREWIVHHHTHRHDDIMTVLRLAKEFNFRVVLHHVSEGWKVAKQIAEAQVPCSVIVVDSPGGKLEAMYSLLKTGAILERAGVLVAFHTDDWITDSRLFFRSAGLAVRAGMSREKALYGLTLAGAVMLGLDGRVGSLKVGKDADFIILSGDPLSVYTKVLETYVDGVKVFDRSIPKDRLYAVGGKGAGDDRASHVQCWSD